MYGLMQLDNFLLAPPIFQVKIKKMSQPTCIIALHLSLQLLKPLCTLTVGRRLAKITEESC